MKQEQLIVYSLLLFIAIPLVITTLGGLMILKGPVGFFPYAKFLIGLTVSLGFLLFLLKNFHMKFGFIYIACISIFHTLSLRHSFLFRDINILVGFALILAFFAGILLCIRYIFLNQNLRSIRTLLFAVLAGSVFTGIFALLLKLIGKPINSTKEFVNDFSMGFMLFATIGIGFLLTDMALNAIAAHYNLKPDLLTVMPVDEDIDDEDEEAEQSIDKKDDND